MKRAQFALSLAVAIAALLALIVLARAPLADYVVEAWLAAKGIPSSVHIERLDFGQVRAKVTLGDGMVPDFNSPVAATLEWRGLTPSVKMLRLSKPRIVAEFDGKTFSIGALGKLINTLKSPAPSPPSTISAMIDGAIVHVTAPQGSVDIVANAHIERGNLVNFNASSKGGTLAMNGARLAVTRLSLAGEGGDGRFALRGGAAGTIARDGLSVRGIAVDFASPAMRLDNGTASYSLSGAIKGTARIGSATMALKGGGAHLTGLHVTFDGNLRGEALVLQASLSASAHVDTGVAQNLAHRIPVLGADAADVRALTAALAQLRLAAPDLRISYDGAATRVSFPQPLTVSGANNAELQLTGAELSLAAGQMWASGAIALHGGGLPEIALNLSSLHIAPSALDSQFRLTTKLSVGAYRDAEISASGEVHTQNGSFRLGLSDCAHLRLASYLSGGRPVLERIGGNICSDGDDILRGNAQGWTLRTKWNATSGKIVAAQSGFARGRGRIALSGTAGGVTSGRVTIDSIAIGDNAKTTRFAPLVASGTIALKNRNWDGTIAVAAKSHKVGDVTVHHAMATGIGSARIAANLAFGENGLQPAALSPLLSGFSKVSGSVGFTGKIAWTRHKMTSGGTLTLSHLDFIAPIGPVSGASGHVTFASLMPLKTQPDQTIALDKIGWIVPATNIAARFTLSGMQLSLTTLTANIAEGSAKFDPMTIDLAKGMYLQSVARFSNINLNALVAATNFADRVKLDVRVSGAVPFSIGPDGIRLNDGTLASNAPGYLAIDRSVWASGTASQGNDAIRDFAYQAMAHLALDRLDGVLNSLPEGRLGLKLHIQGHNAPPEKQPPTTVSLFDLIQGDAFSKPMPLPKNTPVDLTLDTSLNFDELLRAYGELRSGASRH